MRADENAIKFAEDLIKIGNGDANDENDYITVPESCITENNLVDEIFSDIFRSHDYDQLIDSAILSPYNATVDDYNIQCLNDFDGDCKVYNSIDETDNNETFGITTEILNTLRVSSLPEHLLILKKDCPVMLLRNLNLDDGLCNGTRLQILNLGKYVIRCRIMSGEKVGEICFLPRITIIEDKQFPFVLRRHQFPIKLAFAFTINKSQAQTFKKIGIDYTNDVFAHGQNYVALSRGKNWYGIKIKLGIQTDHKIKNIVWREVLND